MTIFLNSYKAVFMHVDHIECDSAIKLMFACSDTLACWCDCYTNTQCGITPVM